MVTVGKTVASKLWPVTTAYLSRTARRVGYQLGLLVDPRVEQGENELRRVLRDQQIRPESLMYLPAFREGYLINEQNKLVAFVLHISPENNREQASAWFGRNEEFVGQVGQIIAGQPAQAIALVKAIGAALAWARQAGHNDRQLIPFFSLVINNPGVTGLADRAQVVLALPCLVALLQERYVEYQAKLAPWGEKIPPAFSFEQWVFFDLLRKLES
ncbi:MAG: hypothetical protein MUC35_06475 [Candidatus Margulisbacteria bacterium]|jgi:hypothetical protein|nr:hypothetical protein [Candidatus Margulisiibacteriota bacterium]